VSGSDVAVAVELETPFLFVSKVGEWREREGGRGKKERREE